MGGEEWVEWRDALELLLERPHRFLFFLDLFLDFVHSSLEGEGRFAFGL